MLRNVKTDAVLAQRKQQLIQGPHAPKCPQPGRTGAVFESELRSGRPAGSALLVRQELLLVQFVSYNLGEWEGEQQLMLY